MSAFRELGMIGTIEEDDNIPVVPESSSSDEEVAESVKIKKKKKVKSKDDFNTDFSFLDQNDPYTDFDMNVALRMAKKKIRHTTLDEKIHKVRKEKTQGKKTEKKSTESSSDDEVEEDIESSDEEMLSDALKVKDKKKRKKRKHETEEEELREKIKFSECIEDFDESLSFKDMNISRPLLKGLSSMQFAEPTPIQSSTISVAMQGRDICACAVTGSGKTVAFMLPILERLLYKPKQQSVTRVLVLVPTRELAVQVHQVSRQLAQFTNIELTLSTGGLDVKAQEAALRMNPDIVIATPGRLIDHLHNSPSFNIANIEILVLDEADRMLDEYFAEQMKEVIRLCNRQRQTMLFSATMTEAVEDLAAVSLKTPVKIFINENTEVALGLRQEFIRIRPNREGDREAIVGALVSRTFRDHCIIFIQTKVQAHRMHIILGLLGINVGELHGNLSQAQRLETLMKFKNSEIDVLLATDLAARGLDIENVKTIINFTMPNTIKHYIHRVGRTARAGKSGRSVSLVGEKERKVLKEVVKKAKAPLKTRIVPQEVVNKYREKINKMSSDVKRIEMEEIEEKEMRAAENQANKVKNMLEPSDDQAKEKRSWFQSHKERKQEKEALRLGDLSKLPSHKQKKKEKKKLTPEDRVSFEIEKSQLFAARSMKRARRPQKMRGYAEDTPVEKHNAVKKSKKKNKGKSSFSEELTSTGQTALKKFRSGPSYQERKELGIDMKKHRRKNRKK